MKCSELIEQLRFALYLLEKPTHEDPIEFEIMDTTFEPVFPDEGEE